MTEAYCLKCKKKRSVSNLQKTKIKNRSGEMDAIKGSCPVCNTKMFKILGRRKP